MTEKKEFMNVKDVAQWMGVSPYTIRSWCSQKLIPRVTALGRMVRFDPEEIKAWLSSGGIATARRKSASGRAPGRQTVREKGAASGGKNGQ